MKFLKAILWRVGEILAVLSRREAAEELATREAMRKYLKNRMTSR